MLLNLLYYVVLDVIEPSTFEVQDVIEPRNYIYNMVPDVIEPSSLRFRCYAPVILGGFMVKTKPDGIGFV